MVINTPEGGFMEKYTCPCCGYKTLGSERSFDICHICFWEDDGLQFENIDCIDGANAVSLRQAQRNFEIFGACDEGSKKFVRKPNGKDIRDHSWTPFE